MMQAFLHLMDIMPFAPMVTIGLVLGITQPTTPMGFAMTLTPGSSRRFAIYPTDFLPRITFHCPGVLAKILLIFISTVPYFVSSQASFANSSRWS